MKTKFKRFSFIFSITILCSLLFHRCNSNSSITNYKGTAYADSIYKEGAQIVPGRLHCEYYDFGGEGVAYHDDDSVNSGSGHLNPSDGSYLNEFRISEAVDISYTKFREPPIDNSSYNLVEPEKDQLYVGWTSPGEWTKYTINAEADGNYTLGLMYTSNQNGKVSFSINDIDVSGPITVPSTFDRADSVAWRQWHHWNYIGNIANIHINKGLQTLTIHTVETGQMNYDFIDFQKVK